MKKFKVTYTIDTTKDLKGLDARIIGYAKSAKCFIHSKTSGSLNLYQNNYLKVYADSIDNILNLVLLMSDEYSMERISYRKLLF